MTTRLRFVAVILLAVCSSVGAQRGPTPQPSIQGVWRVVEQTINDRTLAGDKLGLGFHIYTAGYYAVIRESDVAPRPDVTDVNTATAAQLLATWGPFVAQFGAYEISGDRLIQRILVAKNPSNMRDGRDGQNTGGSRITLEGDTLITEPYNRGEGRMITLKMVRVE